MSKESLSYLTRLQRYSEHKFLSQVQNMVSFFTDLSLHGILGPSVYKTGILSALISIYFNRKCTEIELLDFEFTFFFFFCVLFCICQEFCFLLISEYSGIKRRGKPLPGLRNPGISFISVSIW